MLPPHEVCFRPIEMLILKCWESWEPRSGHSNQKTTSEIFVRISAANSLKIISRLCVMSTSHTSQFIVHGFARRLWKLRSVLEHPIVSKILNDSIKQATKILRLTILYVNAITIFSTDAMTGNHPCVGCEKTMKLVVHNWMDLILYLNTQLVHSSQIIIIEKRCCVQ